MLAGSIGCIKIQEMNALYCFQYLNYLCGETICVKILLKRYLGEIRNDDVTWITQFQIIGYPGAFVIMVMIFQFIYR